MIVDGPVHPIVGSLTITRMPTDMLPEIDILHSR